MLISKSPNVRKQLKCLLKLAASNARVHQLRQFQHIQKLTGPCQYLAVPRFPSVYFFTYFCKVSTIIS